MYAIVETGGKQYRVKPGDTLAVERLAGEPGETLDLERVLLVAGNDDIAPRVGSPGVAGAIVRAEVVEHIRGEKIISQAFTNVRAAYGLDLPYLKDTDGDGFPDVIDPAPFKRGYKDGEN